MLGELGEPGGQVHFDMSICQSCVPVLNLTLSTLFSETGASPNYRLINSVRPAGQQVSPDSPVFGSHLAISVRGLQVQVCDTASLLFTWASRT